MVRSAGEPYGYMGLHEAHAPTGEFSEQALTDGDKAAGWSEIPLFARDDVLEEAATLCEGVTNWGLSPTKAEVAQSAYKFCAKAIRAQRSDSPERAKQEARGSAKPMVAIAARAPADG